MAPKWATYNREGIVDFDLDLPHKLAVEIRVRLELFDRRRRKVLLSIHFDFAEDPAGLAHDLPCLYPRRKHPSGRAEDVVHFLGTFYAVSSYPRPATATTKKPKASHLFGVQATPGSRSTRCQGRQWSCPCGQSPWATGRCVSKCPGSHQAPQRRAISSCCSPSSASRPPVNTPIPSLAYFKIPVPSTRNVA